MSHECNKFIIDGDSFPRNFESMYTNVEDPWNQLEFYRDDLATMSFFHFARYLFDESLSASTTFSILDIGCANGYHAKHFLDVFPGCRYVGTDISTTVVSNASRINSSLDNISFCSDDCRVINPQFIGSFDLIFSSKTLYYVAPEIDIVLANLKSYLKPLGHFCFIYNQTPDSFTNRWLTYQVLTQKLVDLNFKQVFFAEFNRSSPECTALGIFKSP